MSMPYSDKYMPDLLRCQCRRMGRRWEDNIAEFGLELYMIQGMETRDLQEDYLLGTSGYAASSIYSLIAAV
jgi:hypothetical protein